jgi:cytidyltransferase-like protein|tara:strand:+ start:34732 stop:35541 length:810 start_codon:yes stop_codon:yes gene_type:complete
MKNNNLCLVTGGFDPIHSGHIEYLKEAKKISDCLVVGLNSDDWLIRKKMVAFMPFEERKNILLNMEVVDSVIDFNDGDNSACDAISKCLELSERVIFANGGDRGKDNIPEIERFKDNKNIDFIFSVGGSNKLNSSSWIIDDFVKNYNAANSNSQYDILNIRAPWGGHDTIVEGEGYKLKQLFVTPGSKLSLQYHHHRSEHWIVAKGIASVQLGEKHLELNPGEYIFVPTGEKHRICNNTNSDLIIIEVQNGDILEESDIVRLEDSFGRV